MNNQYILVYSVYTDYFHVLLSIVCFCFIGGVMLKYAIASGIVVLSKEYMLIDPFNDKIRKYNDSGIAILEALSTKPLSIDQLSEILANSLERDFDRNDLTQFLDSLLSNGLLTKSNSDE